MSQIRRSEGESCQPRSAETSSLAPELFQTQDAQSHTAIDKSRGSFGSFYCPLFDHSFSFILDYSGFVAIGTRWASGAIREGSGNLIRSLFLIGWVGLFVLWVLVWHDSGWTPLLRPWCGQSWTSLGSQDFELHSLCPKPDRLEDFDDV